jgi:hypothetical protein
MKLRNNTIGKTKVLSRDIVKSGTTVTLPNLTA